MKFELRKITHIAIYKVLLLCAVVGYAQAGDYTLSLDTTKNYEKNLALASASYKSRKKINPLPEEVDKLITNVKVFYNPISEQISVTFKLSKNNVVVIKVMDALGNEVLNLQNSSLDAGMQNLNFDTQEKLTEGFYFVRVSSGSETIVKRISVR